MTNVLIEDIEILNSGHPQAIKIGWNAKNVVVNNVNVLNPTTPIFPSPATNDASGIVGFGVTNFKVTNCTIENIWDTGIGYDECTNVIISNNIVRNFGIFGIATTFGANVLVSNNVLVGNMSAWQDTSSRTMIGINVSDNNVDKGTTYGYLIEGNSFSSLRTPIRFKTLSALTEYYGISILNNIGYDIVLDDAGDLSYLIEVNSADIDSSLVNISGNSFFNIHKPYPDSSASWRLFNILGQDIAIVNNNTVIPGIVKPSFGVGIYSIGQGEDGRMVSFNGIDSGSRIYLDGNYISAPGNDTNVLNITDGTAIIRDNTFIYDTATFSGTLQYESATKISSTVPVFTIEETDGAADNKVWSFKANAEDFIFRVVNDANSVETQIFRVERTGTTIDALYFPYGIIAQRGSTVRDSLRIGTAGKFVRDSFQSTTGDSLGITYYNTIASRLDTVWLAQ
jgi:hypothetical protein